MDSRGVGDLAMPDAIFLSASVPDPRRAPKYAQTADSVAIAAAVSALVHVSLGRRMLIWGGHPSIAPMFWIVADSLGVDYGRWVKLYQSKYFEDEYPEDSTRFQNVVYVEGVDGDRGKSLRRMRERMFKEHRFASAVFIGGMSGVLEEFKLFRRQHPKAPIVPVLSTGGAAQTLSARLPGLTRDLTDELDYVALFHQRLNIPVQEERYRRPEEQPINPADRFWRRL
jgi:hypothetical protein